MIVGTWSPMLDEAAAANEEMLLAFDQQRPVRIAIAPALFHEAAKLRRFTVSVMRALDEAGVDCFLPDLPGMNESLAPTHDQTLSHWKRQLAQFAKTIEATHMLAIRGGALLVPDALPGWRYAALEGAKLLSTMVRSHVIETREAGRTQTREALLQEGRQKGISLAGWDLGPEMIRELESHALANNALHKVIDQADIGGTALWLLAEPGEDRDQSQGLANAIAADLDPARKP